MYLTYSTLLFLVLAIAAFGVWYDSMRVRETANRIAMDACRRRSLQFLDGTVALRALRPRLGREGLRIERTYTFDYAIDGIGRASGFLIMLGQELEHLGLESDRAPT